MTAGCISYKFGMTKIENLSGLKKSMPYTTLAFTLLSFALIGVPLTNGFVSKWYMMKAIIESHAWISLAVFAAGSLHRIHLKQLGKENRGKFGQNQTHE